MPDSHDADARTRSSPPESSSSKAPNMRPGATPFAGLFPPLGPNAHVASSGVQHTPSSASHASSSSSSDSSYSAHDVLHSPTATSRSAAAPAPPPIPEKCLTFCTSRADAPSMCRMFCLRKKAMQATREDDLARLRPKITPHRASRQAEEKAEKGISGVASSAWASFTPLASLRRALSPYSLIYVKGTATGVVGRYMEELEGDDGHRDFGPESRHAEEKRGAEREIAWYSWGDEGALLYVPLTSIFHPILSIPSTLSFFLSPPLRFLTAYRDSFADGTQLRNARMLYEASTDGSAYKMADKLITHHRAKVANAMQRRKEVLAEREAQRADMQAQLDEQKEEKRAAMEAQLEELKVLKGQKDSAQDASITAGKGVQQGSPTGARRGGLRDRIEEAMDRERSRSNDDRVRDADKEREA